MKKSIKISIDGKEFNAPLRKFKTGKSGYGVYGKQLIDNEVYQVSCNIVKVKNGAKFAKNVELR